MSREAIEKTIREIRDIAGKYGVKAFGPIIYTRGDLADRIEADVADIIAENERLKDALKPVLDCITDDIILTSDESSCAEGFDECMNAVNAVDEAKRIYNGGAK